MWFFSYPEVVRKDYVPCLLCTFSALGNIREVAPRAFLQFLVPYQGTGELEAPFVVLLCEYKGRVEGGC